PEESWNMARSTLHVTISPVSTRARPAARAMSFWARVWPPLLGTLTVCIKHLQTRSVRPGCIITAWTDPYFTALPRAAWWRPPSAAAQYGPSAVFNAESVPVRAHPDGIAAVWCHALQHPFHRRYSKTILEC